MIIAANPFKGRRLRARRVDEDWLAAAVRRQAIATDDWVYQIEHGGSVANAYKYRADTECVLAVSDPLGIVVYWTARAHANSITSRRTANACLPGSGDLFDERLGEARKLAAQVLIQEAHRALVPAMLVIAIAAS